MAEDIKTSIKIAHKWLNLNLETCIIKRLVIYL